MSTVYLDYKSSSNYSLSPFFGAGIAKSMEWIHRNEGDKISAASLVDDIDAIENKSAGNFAVVSAQISGIAGFHRYQGQIEQIKIPTA